MKPRNKWMPLTRSYSAKPRKEEIIQLTMQQYNMTRDAAIKMLDDYEAKGEVWINDIYQVQVHRNYDTMTCRLNIRRRDGNAIIRDWRHFQQIKNEVVGPECEAVELYPAESRLVDACNKYHIFASMDPTYRFPFGEQERDVSYDTSNNHIRGLKQRPL